MKFYLTGPRGRDNDPIPSCRVSSCRHLRISMLNRRGKQDDYGVVDIGKPQWVSLASIQIWNGRVS